MQQKLFTLLLLITFFLTALLTLAQDTAENKWIIQTDSMQPDLKSGNSKIVTIGQPVPVKPLTATDKVKIFFTTAYEKYPVWCWIAGFFLLLSAVRIIKQLINK